MKLAFRFTYAFHAREVRFEIDAGEGYGRVFPETFSFRADRHDPAELYLQLEDLSQKPELLGPRAVRRDLDLLMSRLVLEVPRYLERLLTRLENERRLDEASLSRVYEDMALTTRIVQRFVSNRLGEDASGIRLANLLMRKLMHRSLYALVRRRVEPDYLEAYVAGNVDPFEPADDLSEGGFFYTLESGDADAVNRSLMRLSERAFYRWVEDVCLDESDRDFEAEGSPFDDRETEVLRAISSAGELVIRKGRDLSPFLRRPRNRDCQRLLQKLESWFLRQYDVYNAALVIKHASLVVDGPDSGERVLSRHNTRNYLLALGVLISPFVAAAFAYESAPRFFDAVASAELIVANTAVLWFLLYRFCWKKDLTFFRSLVPRIAAGIIVGYLPIFFIDEVWDLAQRSWAALASVATLMGFMTLLYLYVEVEGRLGNPAQAFSRARRIFLLGLLQAFGSGLIMTGLVGRFMASRNWSDGNTEVPIELLRTSLPPFFGELPRVLGFEPFYAFPTAVFMMTFLSFFIGTFLQLMWEDIPITEPL